MSGCRMILTRGVTLWMLLLLLGRPVSPTAVKVVQPYRVESSDGTARVQCMVQPRPSYHLPRPPGDTAYPHPHPQELRVSQRRGRNGNPPHSPSYHLPRHPGDTAYPHPDPEELRVSLLRGLNGNQTLCSDILNFTEQREDRDGGHGGHGGQQGQQGEGEVQCSARVREGAVEVSVSGLRPSDTDMYRCEIEVFYPPPYLRLTGNGTLIHVLGSAGCPQPQRQTAAQGEEGEEEEEEERAEPVSVPVLVLVILVICVLCIIVYFQALQCQGSRRELRRAPAVLHKLDAAAFSC